MRFKVGDRVVVARFYPSDSDFERAMDEKFMGKHGTVLRVAANVTIYEIELDIGNDETCYMYDVQLEFEAIHNSPLYNALKEEL